MTKSYTQLTKEILKQNEGLLNALHGLYEANKVSSSRRGDGTFVRPLNIKRPIPETLFSYGILVAGGCLILPNILPEDILAARNEIEKEREEKFLREREEKEEKFLLERAEKRNALQEVMAGKKFMPAIYNSNNQKIIVDGREVGSLIDEGWELKSLGGMKDDDGNNSSIFPFRTPFGEWLPLVGERLGFPKEMIQAVLKGEEPSLLLGEIKSEAGIKNSQINLNTSGGRFDSKDREVTELRLVAEISCFAEVRQAEFQLAGLTFHGQVIGNRFSNWKEFGEDSEAGRKKLKKEMDEQKEKILEYPFSDEEIRWYPHKVEGLQEMWEILQQKAFSEGCKETDTSIYRV